MNRLRGVLGMLVTPVATESHRGLAVEGWAYNGPPWRLAEAQGAGVVLGARVPIILTSRADTVLARMASCAVALVAARRGVSQRRD